MATIKPRGKRGTLEIRFTAPGGREIRRSSGTRDRRQAEELAARLQADAWRQFHLGERPRRTWREAVERWAAERRALASLNRSLLDLRFAHAVLGDLALDQVDADALARLRALRAATPVDAGRRRAAQAMPSAGTVNRLLATVRGVLRAAHAWGWIDRVPAVTLERAAPPDFPILTRDQAAALERELAPHLRAPFRFTLATGLRERNVLAMEWAWVHLDARLVAIPARRSKGRRAIPVPLNADAVAILEAQRGANPRWVFPSPRGVPYYRANNHGWRAALRRAGLPAMRWHDLRHTWASWHALAGTPLRAIQEMGGWASLAMVERYSHLAAAHLAEHADAVALGGIAGQVPAKSRDG